MENNSYLSEGTLLQGGKYRIVRFIGAGGFGCTYEAVFESIKARVAIKEFFPHELCNRDATGRMSVGTDSRVDFVDKLRSKFVDEASTLFNFKDLQGIVKVTDVFEENGTSYYVMDYIDGRSLRSIINSDGPMPEAEAVRIIREVGLALEGVHGRNCLHLDIKPDNIMLGDDGHPILIDFGVSKQYTREEGCNTSTLMGCTPGYAPLEQMKGNVRSFLPATDIYAMGATLYTLLTGQTPPDVSDLINDSDSLQFPADVSAQTRAAIEAAMQVKVKDRPQTVAAFLAMLPEIGQNAGKVDKSNISHLDTSGTQIMGDKSNGKSGKKYLWIAIAAALAAIIAVTAWQWPTPPTYQAAVASESITVQPDTAVVADVTPTEPIQVAPSETKSTPEPVKTEPQTTTPAPVQQQVSAPTSSTATETAMVAAYTDGGEYRAYTLRDWDDFTAAQRAKVTPIGVQLSASGQKYIVALTEAGNGSEYKWEVKDSYKDCRDIPGLKNMAWSESQSEAKRDFNGRANTNIILAYGREHDINYPAANAAVNYSVDGYSGWFLPASGQLWGIYENRNTINNVLSRIGGSPIGETTYWSSSEQFFIDSDAVYVRMSDGLIDGSIKTSPYRVRPVLTVN